MLVDAGFADVRVEEKAESREFIKDWMPGSGCENYVVSANVTAIKPEAAPVDESKTDAVASSVAAAVAKAAGVSSPRRARGRAVSELGGVCRGGGSRGRAPRPTHVHAEGGDGPSPNPRPSWRRRRAPRRAADKRRELPPRRARGGILPSSNETPLIFLASLVDEGGETRRRARSARDAK